MFAFLFTQQARIKCLPHARCCVGDKGPKKLAVSREERALQLRCRVERGGPHSTELFIKDPVTLKDQASLILTSASASPAQAGEGLAQDRAATPPGRESWLLSS